MEKTTADVSKKITFSIPENTMMEQNNDVTPSENTINIKSPPDEDSSIDSNIIPDGRMIVEVLKKYQYSCSGLRWFRPGNKAVNRKTLTCGVHYFETLTQLRKFLCLYGIENEGYEEVTDREKILLSDWVRFCICPSLRDKTHIPDKASGFDQKKVHRILLRLGFQYRNSSYFEPGVKPKVLSGLSMNGFLKDGEGGIIAKLCRTGLPENCNVDNITPTERLQFELHIADCKHVDAFKFNKKPIHIDRIPDDESDDDSTYHGLKRKSRHGSNNENKPSKKKKKRNHQKPKLEATLSNDEIVMGEDENNECGQKEQVEENSVDCNQGTENPSPSNVSETTGGNSDRIIPQLLSNDNKFSRERKSSVFPLDHAGCSTVVSADSVSIIQRSVASSHLKQQGKDELINESEASLQSMKESKESDEYTSQALLSTNSTLEKKIEDHAETNVSVNGHLEEYSLTHSEARGKTEGSILSVPNTLENVDGENSASVFTYVSSTPPSAPQVSKTAKAVSKAITSNRTITDIDTSHDSNQDQDHSAEPRTQETNIGDQSKKRGESLSENISAEALNKVERDTDPTGSLETLTKHSMQVTKVLEDSRPRIGVTNLATAKVSADPSKNPSITDKRQKSNSSTKSTNKEKSSIIKLACCVGSTTKSKVDEHTLDVSLTKIGENKLVDTDDPKRIIKAHSDGNQITPYKDELHVKCHNPRAAVYPKTGSTLADLEPACNETDERSIDKNDCSSSLKQSEEKIIGVQDDLVEHIDADDSSEGSTDVMCYLTQEHSTLNKFMTDNILERNLPEEVCQQSREETNIPVVSESTRVMKVSNNRVDFSSSLGISKANDDYNDWFEQMLGCILPCDSWTEVMRKMTEHGLEKREERGSSDFEYVFPGKPDRNQNGRAGVDYVTDELTLQLFVKDKFEWKGDANFQEKERSQGRILDDLEGLGRNTSGDKKSSTLELVTVRKKMLSSIRALQSLGRGAKLSIAADETSTSKFKSQVKQINGFLTNALSAEAGLDFNGNYKPVLYVCGSVGVGKTSAVKWCCKQIEMSVKGRCFGAVKSFSHALINGTTSNKKDCVLQNIFKQFNINSNKISMSSFKSFLRRKNTFTVLIVDEIDNLVQTRKDIFAPYDKLEQLLEELCSLAADSKYPFAIIGISNVVEPSKISRLKSIGISGNKISFASYSHDDLVTIVKDRIDTNMVDLKALEFAAKKVANSSGDAREMIGLVSSAINNCLESMNTNQRPDKTVDITKPVVTIRHMMKAVKSTIVQYVERIEALPDLAKTVLCVAVSIAKAVPSSSYSMSYLRRYCSEVSRKQTNHPIDIDIFQVIVQRLFDQGLLVLDEGDVLDKLSSQGIGIILDKPVRFALQLQEVESAVSEILEAKPVYGELMAYVRKNPP